MKPIHKVFLSLVVMNIKPLFIALSIFTLGKSLYAQPSAPPPSSEIKLKFQKLNVLGSVLYFAAHPDDENTRLIAWLAQEKRYRTGYLSLTRGDGGQNLIGTEIGKELGLIRTQELLRARSIDKGEQFFSTAFDFGFSKTYQETFNFWEKEDVLKDAVWIIRKFRPDVIITRFPPDERGGHGHHQASAILAIEAFKIAGDPTKYPEQLVYVQPWQPKRLLWNTFSFGGLNTTAEDQFNIEIGDYNPLIGKSYGEIASESRSSHKSQGFGAAKQRGANKEYFEVLAGDKPTDQLMSGIETSWKRATKDQEIQPRIEGLISAFDISHPEKSIPGLVKLLGMVEQIEDSYWKDQKTREIKDLILDCAGIWMESYAPQSQYAVGASIKVTNDIIVRRPQTSVELLRINGNTIEKPLPYNTILSQQLAVDATHLSQPYWLERDGSLGKFDVADLTLIGNPQNPDVPSAEFVIRVGGRDISYSRPVLYKYTDPVRGEVYQPLTIAPPITVNIGSSAIVSKISTPRSVELLFKSHLEKPQSGKVTFQVPQNWSISPKEMEINFGDERELLRQVTLIPRSADTQLDSLKIFIDGKPAYAYRSIDYDHIPQITWFPSAKSRLTSLDATIPNLKVGYLAGAGDLVSTSLADIGLRVGTLHESEILSDQLVSYDAIVVGIRAFNVNTRIGNLMPHLLKYVDNGGTLVVQYNVNSGLKTSLLGPYPFTITRDRVTDEHAVVQLDAQAPVLNHPNKITTRDFEGWVQERGLYFAGQIPSSYTTPLSMHDKNEQPNKGSLLVVNQGKGRFVYTSLSFFRQLPAGVPGAYRLFVNLLSK